MHAVLLNPQCFLSKTRSPGTTDTRLNPCFNGYSSPASASAGLAHASRLVVGVKEGSFTLHVSLWRSKFGNPAKGRDSILASSLTF
jgi:hypothetical protein